MSRLTKRGRRPFIDILGPLGLSASKIALIIGRGTKQHDIHNDVVAAGGFRKMYPGRPEGAQVAFQHTLRFYRAGLLSEDDESWAMVQEGVEAFLEIPQLRMLFDGMLAGYRALSCTAVAKKSRAGDLVLKIFGVSDSPGMAMLDLDWIAFWHKLDPDDMPIGPAELRARLTDWFRTSANRSSLRSAPESADISAVLNEVMQELLSERHRHVLRQRYGLEDDTLRTLKQIGLQMDISHERVRQVEREAFRRLREQGAHRLLPLIGYTMDEMADIRLSLEEAGERMRQELRQQSTVATTEDESIANLLRRVDALELSVRAQNCLQNAGIEYIYELVEREESEILKSKNFGRKSLNELKEVLGDDDLSFGMTLPDDFPRHK